MVTSYGKAFVATEFGLANNNWYTSFMSTTVKNAAITGSLIWSLRYHNYDGGFYVHSEGPNYWAYHAPGFSPNQGFSSEDATVPSLVRYYALMIQGIDTNAPFPMPPKPVPAYNPVTPKNLRWGGSFWAKAYNIERQTVGTSTWTRIASNVPDNVSSSKTIYSDNSAVAGTSYNYRIQAISVGDKATSDWLLIGPFKA